MSQSSNLVANMALEEWIRRNPPAQHRNLVLLSSNFVEKGRKIKAFFMRESGQSQDGAENQLMEQANLIFNCLPKNAALSELPEVNVQDDKSSVVITVPLKNPEESAVQSTLQCIADNMVEQGGSEHEASRVSLVRPDKGWFPGIQDIQDDMETSLCEIQAIKRDKHCRQGERRHRELPPRHNSFGSYF